MLISLQHLDGFLISPECPSVPGFEICKIKESLMGGSLSHPSKWGWGGIAGGEVSRWDFQFSFCLQ